MSRYIPCPCGGKLLYQKCCQPFHEKKAVPPTAKDLMRSRYCAYALKRVDYIISTTHKQNPNYIEDHAAWSQDILLFCEHTKFRGLEILDFVDGDETATVTFRASLSQNDTDVSFTEKSGFAKLDGRWYYLSGEEVKN